MLRTPSQSFQLDFECLTMRGLVTTFQTGVSLAAFGRGGPAHACSLG